MEGLCQNVHIMQELRCVPVRNSFYVKLRKAQERDTSLPMVKNIDIHMTTGMTKLKQDLGSVVSIGCAIFLLQVKATD